MLKTETRIFGGIEDEDASTFNAVVALKVGTSGDYELCSGVLVSPNVVLTARHCVANNLTSSVSCDENGQSTNGSHVSGDQAPGAVALFLGASPRFGTKADAVGKAIIAPKGDNLCDSDIALVVLDRDIENVEPVAVRLDSGVVPGEKIRSVGYGQNDKKMPLGTRFKKPNVAVLAMGSRISEHKTRLGPHEFEVGRSTCQGDSGGPALSEDTGAVVGVVSRGGDCNEDFGHIYTTTSGWKSLFDEAFAIAGSAPIIETGRPDYPEPPPPPPPQPIRSPLADQPPRTESCSLGPTGGSRGGSWLALVGVCAAVAMVGRRVRSSGSESDDNDG